jgi:hypothetical protein
MVKKGSKELSVSKIYEREVGDAPLKHEIFEWTGCETVDVNDIDAVEGLIELRVIAAHDTPPPDLSPTVSAGIAQACLVVLLLPASTTLIRCDCYKHDHIAAHL